MSSTAQKGTDEVKHFYNVFSEHLGINNLNKSPPSRISTYLGKAMGLLKEGKESEAKGIIEEAYNKWAAKRLEYKKEVVERVMAELKKIVQKEGIQGVIPKMQSQEGQPEEGIQILNITPQLKKEVMTYLQKGKRDDAYKLLEAEYKTENKLEDLNEYDHKLIEDELKKIEMRMPRKVKKISEEEVREDVQHLLSGEGFDTYFTLKAQQPGYGKPRTYKGKDVFSWGGIYNDIEIARVQACYNELVKMGFIEGEEITVDGIFGKKTEEAIKKMQVLFGMEGKQVDGYFGVKTREAFKKWVKNNKEKIVDKMKSQSQQTEEGNKTTEKGSGASSTEGQEQGTKEEEFPE